MPVTNDQLRSKFLNFYSQKQHAVVPSAPLIPENDATTLFISSGMQPLLEYFLGVVHPLGSRIVNSQKCFRSQDIEEVGDNRHTTFFEMLGNWSFGDYFKSEQIESVFTFLTKELGLDPARLFVTVFGGSSELGNNNLPLTALMLRLLQTRLKLVWAREEFVCINGKPGGLELVNRAQCRQVNRVAQIVRYFLTLGWSISFTKNLFSKINPVI